jgi:hypothetical protein
MGLATVIKKNKIKEKELRILILYQLNFALFSDKIIEVWIMQESRL